MFEGLTEIWNAFFNWAKENGDVLGTIGFLFAMFTVVVTNGRLILQRMRGEEPDFPFNGVSPEAVSTPSGVPSTSTSLVVDAPPPRPDYGNKTAIAVMPPKEMGDLEDHFAEGLAEDLVADLQQGGFACPDPTTVAKMAYEGVTTNRIARDLGVGHVLATNIRRQDEKIRVTAKLIDPTGAVYWSDRFNAAGDDHMAIQESIAAKIAAAVKAQLGARTALTHPETGVVYKTREEALSAVSSPKSRLTALLIAATPLGLFGVHRFYLGRPFTGILYPFTAGLFIFGWAIDFILIAIGTFADGKGLPVRIWRPDPLKKFQ